MLEALGVHREANFLFGLPSDMADDLEQLMRVFKVKICERVCPGFWSSVGTPPQDSCMERRMCHLDPRPETHWRWSTAFGFDGKKPVEQAKWHRDHRRWARVCATVRDPLDEKETSHFRSMVGSALCVVQDRPEAQNATKDSGR